MPGQSGCIKRLNRCSSQDTFTHSKLYWCTLWLRPHCEHSLLSVTPDATEVSVLGAGYFSPDVIFMFGLFHLSFPPTRAPKNLVTSSSFSSSFSFYSSNCAPSLTCTPPLPPLSSCLLLLLLLHLFLPLQSGPVGELPWRGQAWSYSALASGEDRCVCFAGGRQPPRLKIY